MTEDKPAIWVDLLLSAWVVVVGVVYYGGYFVPIIGAFTANASAIYALILLISVVAIADRYLRRPSADKPEASARLAVMASTEPARIVFAFRARTVDGRRGSGG